MSMSPQPPKDGPELNRPDWIKLSLAGWVLALKLEG